MSFDLARIFHEMGVFARGIAATLSVMAVASLAVFFERLWAFARARSRSRAFRSVAAPLLERRAYDEVIREASGYVQSPLAQMISNGLSTFTQAERRGTGKLAPVELVRRELERKKESDGARVRRGMSLLASVGSVAPFVGLLGTVVGIISAFQGIAKEGSGGLGAVSSGIAEALVVTAFGLLVAIPAVLAFNFLSTRADALLAAVDEARGELVDLLEDDAAAEPRKLESVHAA